MLMTPHSTLCLCGVRASASGTSLSSASTSFFSLFPNVPRKFLVCCDHCGLLLYPAVAFWHVFALINPALPANYAIRGIRFRRSEIDVGAQRLQRQPPLQVPFFAGDFRPIQPAGHANLDALAPETKRRIHRLAHRATKRYPLFQLQRNRLGNQGRVQLRAVYFLNVDVHFALGALLHVLLQLVDFRAFAADDDSRPRGEDSHHQFVSRAFDIDRADTGRLQLFFQFLAQFHIFVQQFGVVASRKPARLPRLVVAQAESVWMCFLSHCAWLPLLALLCSLLFSCQSLPYAPRGSTNALVRFRFRYVAGMPFRGRHMMFGHRNPNMRGTFLIAKCAAHGRRTQPLPACPFIHKTFRNIQLIDIQRRTRILWMSMSCMFRNVL